MVTNLPGLSGLPVSAAHKKRRQQAQEAELPSPFLAEPQTHLEEVAEPQAEDVFDKRPASPEREGVKTPESPGSEDELDKFLRELYADAAAQDAPRVVMSPPDDRPRLRRTETYYTFPAMGATPVVEAPPESEPVEALEIKSPRARRNAGFSIDKAPVQEAGQFGEFPGLAARALQPEAGVRGRRHHRRNRLSSAETQAVVKEAQKRFSLKVANRLQPLAPPASPEQLRRILQIPYQYVLLGPGQVDPYLTPEQAAKGLSEAHRLVVGDMHASFQKLVEVLVVADMVEMPPMAARKFVLLARLANDRKLPMEKLAAIQQDLQQVISTMRWKGGDRQLILMGDMLADRGPLDSVTLELVRHLRKQAPKSVVALASNHDHGALNYLTAKVQNVIPEQATSLFRALKVAKATNTKAELSEQYYKYLHKSQLLHFDPASNTLLTHAPISEAQLRKLHTLLPKGTPSVDEIHDAAGVIRFVDAANRFYKDYVKLSRQVVRDARWKKSTGQSLPEHHERERELAKKRKQIEVVLVSDDGFLWARNLLTKKEEFPFHRAGVKTLLHGHDSQSIGGSPFSLFQLEEKEPDYTVVSLDQEVRKGSEEPTEDDLKTLYILA